MDEAVAEAEVAAEGEVAEDGAEAVAAMITKAKARHLTTTVATKAVGEVVAGDHPRIRIVELIAQDPINKCKAKASLQHLLLVLTYGTRQVTCL